MSTALPSKKLRTKTFAGLNFEEPGRPGASRTGVSRAVFVKSNNQSLT